MGRSRRRAHRPALIVLPSSSCPHRPATRVPRRAQVARRRGSRPQGRARSAPPQSRLIPFHVKHSRNDPAEPRRSVPPIAIRFACGFDSLRSFRRLALPRTSGTARRTREPRLRPVPTAQATSRHPGPPRIAWQRLRTVRAPGLGAEPAPGPAARFTGGLAARAPAGR